MLVAKSSRKPDEGGTDQQLTGLVTVITGSGSCSNAEKFQEPHQIVGGAKITGTVMENASIKTGSYDDKASETKGSVQTTAGAMKVKVLQWHAVASWTWDAQDETCGICRMAFDGCCPDCKFPGDDCPIIWGACNHAFHLHCILKWVNSQTSTPLCPMCRREWQFKG
ncbi:hypothetical protein QYE76_000504 [Lolium multiflorum]|uniref:Anaphase-promoting complex subunit 11 n=3 Tax=Poeae TaxID=147387 RepID=A0AAD8RJD9_LOLMU|nr:hypothetical protein QYE76_000504 [Lolium multiflorum]